MKIDPKWVQMEAPGLRIGGNAAKRRGGYNAYSGLAWGAIFKKYFSRYFPYISLYIPGVGAAYLAGSTAPADALSEHTSSKS